jgi:Protein of unknown function (DUF2934)
MAGAVGDSAVGYNKQCICPWIQNPYTESMPKSVSKIKGGNDQVSETAETETAGILHKLLNRSLEERIRERAYELYVQRGSQDGRADLDWCEADNR